MKKLLSLLLLTCMLVSIFSCSKEENEPTVTEEEWISALKFDTFPTFIDQKLSAKYGNDTDFSFIYHDVLEFDGDIIRNYELDEEETENSYERIYSKEGDTYYVYAFNPSDNSWSSNTTSKENYEARRYDKINFGDGSEEYSYASVFSYDDFTYNEEDQAYHTSKEITVSNEDESMTLYNVVLKFCNGKLVRLYFESTINSKPYLKCIMNFKYTEIDLVLPEVE